MLKLTKICDSIIEYSFYLLLFIVPLIMTPWNYELFEFNKMLTVYFFTTIIVATWLIKMVLEKRVIFKKTFWNIPLFIFLASQFLSFIFSIDRHTSFWGYYSRFNGGLLSTFCYLFLYWAFINSMDKRKTLYALRCVIFSAILVAAYGIAEHFGIDAQFWVQDVKNRVFSTLGQPNWLAAWIITLIPLGFAFALEQESKIKKQEKVKILKLLLFYFFTFLLYLCFIFTKSRSGLLGLAIAFIFFWASLAWVFKSQIRKLIKPFLIFTIILIIFNLLINTPWKPNFLKFNNSQKQTVNVQALPSESGGTESGEIRKIVWKGALAIWENHPIFGTGPETFAYSYYWYRPREHNDISEWDFLYNKAHNEYLNYASTTGTIGLITYLGLIGSFIFWGIKKIKEMKVKNSKIENWLIISLLSGFVSILITNFFGFAVVPVSLLFFLFPAMAFTLSQEEQNTNNIVYKKETLSLNWIQKSFILFFVLCAMFYILRLAQYWYADKTFSLGEKLNNNGQISEAFNNLQKAIKIRPYEPIYYDELSLAASSLAVGFSKEKQSTLSAQLTEIAIEASNKSLVISPFNVNFWKNRTRIFYSLAEINNQYQEKALEALLQASKLAPTDAKILYNLALVYNKLGQKELAIRTLEDTIILKPNYDHARYALALFYEEKRDLTKAKEQLKYIIEKINPNYEPALEKLKEMK